MKKLKTFVYVLKNSISSPKYYNDIVKSKINFSIKYFLALSFLVSVISVIGYSIIYLPKYISEIKISYQSIEEGFPEDFVIEFKDGSWSSNKEGPVIIKKIDLGKDNKLPQNLFVFDKEGTIEKIDEYNTMFLINSENILCKTDTEGVIAQPLKNIPNGKLDKNLLNEKMQTVKKVIGFLPYLLPLALLIPTFLFEYVGGSIFIILISAVGVYIASISTRKKIDFKSAFQICIHASTIPMIVRAFSTVSPVVYGFILNWLLFIILAVSLFFRFRMEEDTGLKKINKE